MAYSHSFTMRAVNNLAYLGFVPSPERGETLVQQLAQHRSAIASVIPQLADLWKRVWLPSILPRLERLRASTMRRCRIPPWSTGWRICALSSPVIGPATAGSSPYT